MITPSVSVRRLKSHTYAYSLSAQLVNSTLSPSFALYL